jgi:hypothetical protein
MGLTFAYFMVDKQILAHYKSENPCSYYEKPNETLYKIR